MDIFYLFLDKFKGETKRIKEHNAGLYLVEYAAKKIFKIKNTEISVVNNKPCFKYSDLNFSISHSNNIAAVCFDENPIGFDIEFIKNRNYLAIAKHMNFNLKQNSINEFYVCWTKYEAEYKLQNTAKNIYTGIFNENYIYAIASSENKIISANFICVEL